MLKHTSTKTGLKYAFFLKIKMNNVHPDKLEPNLFSTDNHQNCI